MQHTPIRTLHCIFQLSCRIFTYLHVPHQLFSSCLFVLFFWLVYLRKHKYYYCAKYLLSLAAFPYLDFYCPNGNYNLLVIFLCDLNHYILDVYSPFKTYHSSLPSLAFILRGTILPMSSIITSLGKRFPSWKTDDDYIYSPLGRARKQYFLLDPVAD